MPHRRILSLWFPRLGAERVLRQERWTLDAPLAVIRDTQNMQTLSSLSAAAEAAGLRAGQSLRDAMAMCPDLITRPQNAPGEAAMLTALRRWAGKFSPWIAEEPPASLIVDLTGCAHLFGGEAALIAQLQQDCTDLGLSLRAGIADTVGAAWALARYAGHGVSPDRSGDAIDQEARATRSRAAKRRHWERGGAAPQAPLPAAAATPQIAAPGQTRQALNPLPIAALRLGAEDVTALNRLGLRRVEDLAGQPRAALARRFGRHLVQRLDQALGIAPEPVSPSAPPLRFAVRMSLPDPIGLEADLLAGMDRLLPPLCQKLRMAGQGARRLRLQAFRVDHAIETIDIGLARPADEADSIRPLFALKLGAIDAGHGIDRLRIEAYVTEPVHARQFKGHLDAARDVQDRLARNTALDDLIGRLGARLGVEAVQRLHPADSHIPEKTSKILTAAWSDPASDPASGLASEWPAAPTPRPLQIWRPEPVMAEDRPKPPQNFRWRRRDWHLAQATGPERIAPEWWLDDPAWRSGTRDYWHITTQSGELLWLYYAHGGGLSSGWFCQGSFT
ncbi:MAG: Y-family DNA polymerase [Mangrovicoccus sp.]